MSAGKCIPELLGESKLTKDQADRAREIYDGHVADLKKSMSPAAAEAVATKRTLDAMDFEAAEAARRKLLQVKAQDFAEDWLTRGGEHWGGGGGRGGGGGTPGEGPKGAPNPKAAQTLIVRMDVRRDVIEGEAFGKMSEILARHRTSALTGKLRNRAEMDDLGMEAFGEDSGNPTAKIYVAAKDEAEEWLRLRANAAGANIGKLEKRGFSTHHDSDKVAEAGFDAWAAAEIGYMPGLGTFDRSKARWDLDRTVDEQTGEPFTEAALLKVAREVHATIASDGWSKRAPGGAGTLSFANKLGQHRFIHYKGYAEWKASQEQFGAGTAFDALLGEVKGMSRAIAAMEMLGPNPEATIRYVKDRLQGDDSLFLPGQLKAKNKAHEGAQVTQRLWDEYVGSLRQPENRTTARAFSAYRAFASSTKLGSAPVTAISDLGYGMATRSFNGLPVAGIVRDYLKLFNPLDERDRMTAARLSFVPETWTSAVAGQTRFMVQELAGERARWVSERVFRLSGLSAITDAGRGAHGLVTFIHATEVRDQAFGDLEPAWRAALQRYGIDEKGWDEIRGSAIETMPNGLTLLTPQTLGEGETKNRFLEMAHNERDFSVVVPDLHTRSYLNANFKSGTKLGESIRSSPLMFRTFTISAMLRHGGRLIEQPSIPGILGYALRLAIPVTVFGGLSQALYEILNGRDLPPMDPRTPEGRHFWLQAMVKGGAVGMLGDIIGLTAQGAYEGLGQYALGPLIGDLDRLRQGLTGLATGKPRAKAQLFELGKENVPGNNLWYTRLITDRLLADEVKRSIDPNYDQNAERMQRRARENGQGYFWAPGTNAPQRAPNLLNAIEGGTHQ